ncbi:MAG TPA: arylsulfatase [Gemmataceae bacterium]|nr:arylsulfatase [Gemmataceae bacterium]
MSRFAAALFTVVALACGSRLTAADRPPNIVLIIADDLGWAELGCYGQKLIRTPSVDRLAEGGMKFTRFYAGNAVCAPSRCALMTGKHMGHTTVRDNKAVGPEGQFPIKAEDLTVTELLKAKGYATGAMGKWGLGMWDTTGSPLKHGFDLFYGYNCQGHAHSHYPTYLYRNDKRFELPGNNGVTGDSYTQDLFEKEAIAFIEAHKGEPFFLYLPFIVPHTAVQVPEDSLAEYKGKLGDDPPYDGKTNGKPSYLPHPTPHAAYAAMVTRMDRSVGRIVEKIKAAGLENDTLIIFTSDNGPAHNYGGTDSTFFKSAGNLRGLKGSLYEGGIRVPFIAYWPGKIRPRSECDTRFYFPDILPTLCAIAKAEPPKGIDGISFTNALFEQALPARHEFLYWEFPSYGGQQAVIEGNWKAVRQNLAKGVVKTELYDLAKDPNETTDLAAKEPDVLARLETRLKEQHTPNPDFPLPAIDPKK